MKRVYTLMMIGLLNSLLLSEAHAQQLAVKSNLLSDALISPNAGVELLLSSQWTLDVMAHYQPFASGDNRRWKHWLLQPEVRRWFCVPFAGHFVGAHLLGGRFNVGDVHLPFDMLKGARDSRYEGWLTGAGISYGYHWVLAPHWSIEASLGIGAAFVRSDRYRCGHCGEKLRSAKSQGYFGPTKAAISLVYMIK